MSLKLLSVTNRPLTLALALEYRDMKPLKSERPLLSARVKRQVKLLSEEKLFTLNWGKCRYERIDHRGNGNHTSNVTALCMQATRKQLDEKSVAFFSNYVASARGEWIGEMDDLPALKDGQLTVSEEIFEADSEVDLIDFFRRYDAPRSARTSKDIQNIYISQHDDLSGLVQNHVRNALAGVLRLAKSKKGGEPLSLDENEIHHLRQCTGDTTGEALSIGKVRDVVQWIVENVGIKELYQTALAAQLCAEVYLHHGPEVAGRIFEEVAAQAEGDVKPGSEIFSLVIKRRAQITPEVLLTKGRKLYHQIANQCELQEV